MIAFSVSGLVVDTNGIDDNVVGGVIFDAAVDTVGVVVVTVAVVTDVKGNEI